MKFTARSSYFKFGLLIAFLSSLLVLNSFQSTLASEGDIYKDAFPLQTYDSRFYLVYMENAETIELNLTNTYNGDFDIFIHDDRPLDYYISQDGYDSRIYDNAVAYNTSAGNTASVTYTVSEAKIYYIQVVMVANGPDTYHLNSSQPLELYFIPYLIPGFNLNLLGGVSVLA